MRSVKMLPQHNERDRICSEAEYGALTENASPALRLAIIIAYHTGLRMGEVAGLAWDDINFAAGAIRLHAGKTKTGEGRVVPALPTVLVAIQLEPRRLDGRLFTVDKRTLSPAFARLCRKLGIKNLRFHDLRHTAATSLRRAGVDIFTIAAITGHKDLASLRRYNTVTVDDMREAMSRVPRKPFA